MQRGKNKQVAQLSQKDRATGWVSYGQNWKIIELEGNILTTSIFNNYDVIGQQSNQIR